MGPVVEKELQINPVPMVLHSVYNVPFISVTEEPVD